MVYYKMGSSRYTRLTSALCVGMAGAMDINSYVWRIALYEIMGGMIVGYFAG